MGRISKADHFLIMGLRLIKEFPVLCCTLYGRHIIWQESENEARVSEGIRTIYMWQVWPGLQYTFQGGMYVTSTAAETEQTKSYSKYIHVVVFLW